MQERIKRTNVPETNNNGQAQGDILNLRVSTVGTARFVGCLGCGQSARAVMSVLPALLRGAAPLPTVALPGLAPERPACWRRRAAVPLTFQQTCCALCLLVLGSLADGERWRPDPGCRSSPFVRSEVSGFVGGVKALAAGCCFLHVQAEQSSCELKGSCLSTAGSPFCFIVVIVSAFET